MSGQTADSMRYGSTASVSDPFDITSFTGLEWFTTIKSYQQAPLLVAIGDSIIAGHPGNYSGAEDSLVNVPANSITGQLELLNSGYVSQNMGIGGEVSTEIKDRFTSDVVDLKPKLALINGGINDISSGSVNKTTMLSNYTTMLDACVTNNIVPVVCKITPWTGGTNEQMQDRDDRMSDLQTLVATYSGAVWCDFDESIGKFRSGGDSGNLWDYKSGYSNDNVHPNLTGYTAMAEVINLKIRAKYSF